MLACIKDLEEAKGCLCEEMNAKAQLLRNHSSYSFILTIWVQLYLHSSLGHFKCHGSPTILHRRVFLSFKGFD